MDVEEITNKISALKDKASAFQDTARKVTESCTSLGRSWSGSSLVGHGKYFYGNFQEPAGPQRFSIEWGLINGVPRGWEEKSAEQVRAKIEEMSGASLDSVSNLATELENGFTDVQREAVLKLAENGFTETDTEKIEKFTVRSATDIFNDIFPTKFMTRDVQSATGNYIAPHIYYDAVARFILSFPDELKSFLFELEKIVRKKAPSNKPENPSTQKGYYVENSLILSLATLKPKKYDLVKLVKMCQELNDNYSLENYLACGMLIRAILDHVPPIFEKKNFAEVANNYGTKSFKDIVLPLEDSARKISDSYLHNPIKSKELLPSKTQISFQPNMDVLLSEVVRILSSS
jgi:hypothetical protein